MHNRKTHKRHFTVPAMLLAALGQMSVEAEAAPAYNVVDLGVLTGGTASYAYDINDSGQIVGYSKTPQGDRAFLLNYGSSGMAGLGTLGKSPSGGEFSYAYGINNHGQITGWSTSSTHDFEQAYIYENGAMTSLGYPGGSPTHTRGWAINDSGVVAGEADLRSQAGDGSAYYAAGAWQFIIQPSNYGNYGAAYDVNNVGQIVGYSENGGAFLFDGGAITSLPSTGYSVAYAINDTGAIVGANAGFAAIWDGGILTTLNTPGSSSAAYDINDAGVTVGRITYNFQTGNIRAFQYQNGVLQDLNSLIDPSSGWLLQSAEGLNESGQIVGWGVINGQTHAFLLNPVPEADTYLMMLAGIGLVGLAVRKQRRGNTGAAG